MNSFSAEWGESMQKLSEGLRFSNPKASLVDLSGFLAAIVLSLGGYAFLQSSFANAVPQLAFLGLGMILLVAYYAFFAFIDKSISLSPNAIFTFLFGFAGSIALFFVIAALLTQNAFLAFNIAVVAEFADTVVFERFV